MKSLEVEHLGKCYRPTKRGRQRDIWALEDVSFTVDQGTVLGIVGPNGAGKTTLLKVLARITPPTTGRVKGRGRVVPLLALGSGFQQDMSGRDNIFMNAAMYGIAAGEVRKRLDDIVDFAGLTEAIDQPLKEYSSGMYLRLAFSVAINLNPDILLADEVLAVGDLEFQERCLRRVEEVSREGVTVLFVSHDMGAISRLCTRALMLNGGQLIKDGSTEEIVTLYQEAAWTRGRRRRRGGFANDYGELLFVKLTGADGSELAAAKSTEDAYVTLGFRIARPGVTIRPACDLFARGSLAFRTMDSQSITIKEPGTYTASARIPAHLLAEIVYSVNAAIDIWTPAGEYRPVSDLNALTFRVYGSTSAQAPSLPGRTHASGVLAPALDWHVTRDETVAGAVDSEVVSR